MKEPTIRELEIALKYIQNPGVYGHKEGIIALVTMWYCKYTGTTMKELLKTKKEKV